MRVSNFSFEKDSFYPFDMVATFLNVQGLSGSHCHICHIEISITIR